MDGNEAPPPMATMDPRTSLVPDQPAAQSWLTHNSIGGPIITSTEDISSPRPKRAVMTVNGNTSLEGLRPPTLKAMGQLVSRVDTDRLHLQNKRQQQALQVQQIQTPMRTTHMGSTKLPTSTPLPPSWRGDMWPSGIITSHPAGEFLAKWSQLGCPTWMGDDHGLSRKLQRL